MIESLSFDVSAYLAGAAAVFALMTVMWGVSVARRDASVADPTWPVLFLLAALVFAARQEPFGARSGLLLALVLLWSLRLGGYLTWRNLEEDEEDKRYRTMRENQGPGFWWKSLGTVFWLQALLATVISLPLLAATDGDTTPLGWLDAAAVVLWIVGMIFEAGGDFQLARFKADPSNEGEVLDSGLWRYTRHPNYFGDFCVWWAFYLLAVAAGGWWWALPGPLLMSFLLMKVSGVTLTESTIEERRPQYAEYKRRTNAFFPGPPSDG